MITIKLLRKKNKALKDFEKREWKIADIEHYGKETWKAKRFIFAAWEKDEIAGFIEFEISAGICHIEALLIARDKRRLGIGKSLMNKAEKVALRSKVHKIFLTTGKKWESAKFYETLGYKVEAIFHNHYGGQDFIQYIKYLN